MVERIKEAFWPVAKAWTATAAAAVSPHVVGWIQEAGDAATNWAIGSALGVLAWVSTWAVPNKG